MRRMRKVFLNLLLLFLIPSLGLADVLILQNGSKAQTDNVIHKEGQAQIQYAGTSLTITKAPITNIELENYPQKDTSVVPFIEKIAEAAPVSTDSVMTAYFRAHAAIQNAWAFKDVRPVVTDQYLLQMGQKVKAGANEKIILMMTQNLRPDITKIIDSRINEDKAKLAVVGHSPIGELYGIIHLVNQNGVWKIEKETWFTGDTSQAGASLPIVQEDTFDIENYDQWEQDKLFWDITLNEPDYFFDDSILPLSKPQNAYTRDEAFMLVFFMEKNERRKKTNDELSSNQSQRKNFHILWTGPKELVPDQKIIKYKRYPVDVSIADEDDGYLPSKMNLRLPEERPNEVCASFMLSF